MLHMRNLRLREDNSVAQGYSEAGGTWRPSGCEVHAHSHSAVMYPEWNLTQRQIVYLSNCVMSNVISQTTSSPIKYSKTVAIAITTHSPTP